MKRNSIVAAAVVLGLSSAHATAPAPGPKPPGPAPLVRLDVETPQNRKDLPTPLVTASGWVLSFKLSASPDNLGIAASEGPRQFTAQNRTSYVVFSDPDGCLALPPPFVRPIPDVNNPTPCDTAASDETYLQFTPDQDAPGVQDFGGDPAVRAALADPARSGEPQLRQFDTPNGTWFVGPHGPMTGGTVSDGFGYGADDDLPGLVVLAASGPGLAYDTNFNRLQPRQRRNLAGFGSWVGATLREPGGRTTVYSGMVVPYGLFLPFMAADDCVGPPLECVDAPRYRIDGGPVQTSEGNPYQATAQFRYLQLVRDTPLRIRAFVVSGIAPSVLADGDGDGDVDAQDARLAGYTVLSNEVSVSVRRFHDDPCAIGVQNVFNVDLDGNGSATSFFVCPGGPGQIRQPPD